MNSKFGYAPFIASVVIVVSWIPMVFSILTQLNWQVMFCANKANLLILLGFGLWSFTSVYIGAYSVKMFRGTLHNPFTSPFQPLILALITHLSLSLMADSLLVGLNYYLLRASLPLIVLCFSQLGIVNVNLKPRHRIVVYVATLALTAVTVVLSLSFFSWIICSWSLLVSMEYLGFGIVYFELFHRRLSNSLEAFAYTLLTLLVVGFIYELPIGLGVVKWVSLGYPFLLRSALVALILVVYKVRLVTFKKPMVLMALLGLVAFSVYYGLNPWFYAYSHAEWIPRLPTFLFWLIIMVNMGSNENG